METTVEKEKKARVPVKVELKKVAKTALKEAEKRLSFARNYYGQMQKNWFMFAKEIREIRDRHDHDIFGVESFQKLCEREFPLASYSTISKFIQIVEKLGDQIETRLKREDYLLPTYETCYQLTTVESKVKSEDYSKLKKQILDEKLTVRSFREKLTSILGAAKRKMKEEIDAEADAFIAKTQREFDEDLRKDKSWDEEGHLMGDEDFEPEEVDEEDTDIEEPTPGEMSLVGLNARIDYLMDNLPEYIKELEAIDGPTRALGKKLKKLGTIINDVVETIEEEGA